MRKRIRIGGAVIAALLAAAQGFADSRLSLVPWKVLEPGGEPLKMPLVLFWIPTSPEEMRRSDLITSYRLTAYASRCVGMQVVRTDDRPMLAKLSAVPKTPAAILRQGDKEIGRVTGEPELAASAVEAMVREAIDRRELAVNATLDEAEAKKQAGDRASAIELYRQVAGEACLFPRLAKTAQRALRRLGVR